jgi:AraC-like DNA-binding protein
MPDASLCTFSQAACENAKRYYKGETTLEANAQSPHLDLTMLSSPYPMARVRSRSKYVFRRSWDDIRDNKENVVTLRYMKSGSMSVSQLGKTCQMKAGDFSFTRSNIPFFYENQPNLDEPVDWVFILFPLEVVHRHFPNGVPICTSIATAGDRQLAMPRIMSMLCEVAESIDRNVTDHLINALLQEAAILAEQQGAQVGPRQSIGEKRIEDIISYITLHMANPELTMSAVAQGCKISPRYLCHLLKEHKTTFSQLLWTGRLNESKVWLCKLDKRHYGISEIAYMTGYKSVAHFSRMFRERFGCAPREFRRLHASGEAVLADTPKQDVRDQIALCA